ncbi:MAG: hypothetical protein LQ352_002023 [Teloschistes flavicans]|nr:MAG: hypothetical protein LQ352_002023 [Teloschistes flavicans]
MAGTFKNVVVIGASGNVGKPTVDALLKAGFTVTALTRKTSSAKFPSEVKTHQIDDNYPSEQLLDAFKGQDAVVNLLPPIDINQHNTIADKAAEAGVKRFIPTEFGSDTAESKVVQLVPMFGGKAAITGYLKKKESSGMTWTAIVNGAFFDWGLQTGFLGFDLKSHTAQIYDAGDAKINMTTLSVVGQSVASVLQHPAETANRYVYVQSTVGTQNEILAALEKSTSEKWTINKISSADARKEGGEKLSKGDMSGILPSITGGIYSGEQKTNYDETHGTDNDLLGLKQTPLEELVDKVVKGQPV